VQNVNYNLQIRKDSELCNKFCQNTLQNDDKFGSNTTDNDKNPNQYGMVNDNYPNQ